MGIYACVPSDFSRVCVHACQYLCIQCVPCVQNVWEAQCVCTRGCFMGAQPVFSLWCLPKEHFNFRPVFFPLICPSILFKPSAVPFLPPPLALFLSILSSLHHAWPNKINLSVSLVIDTLIHMQIIKLEQHNTSTHTPLCTHAHRHRWLDSRALLYSGRPLPPITLTLCQEALGRVIMTSVSSPYRWTPTSPSVHPFLPLEYRRALPPRGREWHRRSGGFLCY